MLRETIVERSAHTLGMCVSRLRDDAVSRRGVHPDLAAHAAESTLRGLRRELSSRPLRSVDRQRVRSYYDAVLRRTAFGRPIARDTAYRERVKVASLIADLNAVDTDVDRIRAEIRAFFGLLYQKFQVG